jgi:hypothetical protein
MMIVQPFFGCGEPATDIAEIQKDAARFTEEEVIVEGEVIETLALPFVKPGAYLIDDGTGKLWIIRDGAIPRRGDTVKVKGTVAVSFEIGGEQLGTVLMEKTGEK